MAKVIGVTAARARLKEVVDEVERSGEEVILARDSRPAAVLIPYAAYEEHQVRAREAWRARLEATLLDGRAYFKAWAKKKGFRGRLTERRVAEIVRGA